MVQRLKITSSIIVTVFLLFALRLWFLQIIKKDEAIDISRQNRIRVIKIPAPRGIIFDRNEIPLVKNIPSFDVAIAGNELKKNPENISKICHLLEMKEEEFNKKLNQGGRSTYEPVTIKEGISWKELAKIEARKMDFPYLDIVVGMRREYIHHELAGHVIGYLGHLSEEQIENPDYKDVPRISMIGQRGIEKHFDKKLRGVAGKKIIEVDALGREINMINVIKPTKGDDITLSIDLNLQNVAENALKDQTGAIVVLDPRNGEILVMASRPSFDPNLFSKGISSSDWKLLIEDPQKPLLNRTIQSYYPPGSTFKIITALAALQDNLIEPETTYQCNGAIYLGKRRFACWKHAGHGSVNLYKALVESCDVYFYEIAKKLKINRLATYARSFGLGFPVGMEFLGEKSGIIPDSNWKKEKKGQPWYPGETLITVIGQGYITTTPIQMAQVISAVANGGTIYKPHLLKGQQRVQSSEIMVEKEFISVIKNALKGVVEDKKGTASIAKSELITMGGKTGTAQVVSMKKYTKKVKQFRDHAWFVAYSPSEDPHLAMAILVEHGGHGGSTCAPIAKEIAETFYKKNVLKHQEDE